MASEQIEKKLRQTRRPLDRLISHRQISRLLKGYAPTSPGKCNKGFRIKRKTVDALRRGVFRCAHKLVDEIELLKSGERGKNDVSFHLPRHIPDLFIFLDDFDDTTLPSDETVVQSIPDESATDHQGDAPVA